MKRAIAALVLTCATNVAMAGTLSTAAATGQGNWNWGSYLNLTPTVDLTVYSIDYTVPNVPAGGGVAVYVYTCNSGSYVGNDATAANWTLASFSNAYSNGGTALTRFTLKTPLVFPAGVTRGVMLWSPSGIRDTVGAAAVQTFANADLTLFSERRRNALFAGTATTPAVFSGNINYTRANQIEGAGAVEPYNVEEDCNALLTVNTYLATSPASTNVTVTADLSGINGSGTQPLFDNGTNGDVVAGDNVYSYLANVPSSSGTGLKAIPFTVTDQNSSYNSNLSINLNVVSEQLPKTLTLPKGHSHTGGAAGQNLLLQNLNAPRTAQFVYIADELKPIPIGAKIDAVSFRLQPNATNNPPPSYPSVDLHYANYDVKLSKLPAGMTLATMSNTDYPANIDAGSAVLVRSGPLTVPAASFGAGAALPNANPMNEVIIDFTTPYVYDGQDLVITISHSGSDNAATGRLMDSFVVGHPGVGTRFRCISGNGYNATTGGAPSQTTILRVKYHTDLTGTATFIPPAVEQGCNTLVTLQVTPGSNPASTGVTVTADLTPLGGAPGTQLFDDGSNGDVTQNDGIYSLLQTVPLGQQPGSYRIRFIVEDEQCRIDDVFKNVNVVAPLSGVVSSTPASLAAGCQTLIKVAVMPAICSTSTNIGVVADLFQIGGAPNQMMFDNATNGDQVAGDFVFSYLATVSGSLSVGQYSGAVTITDNEGHVDQPSWVVDVVSPFANAVAAASPQQASVGATALVTLNLNIQPCAVSTNRTVTADLSLLGGSSSQPMLDNGVAPDASAGDNVYTTSLTVPPPACATYLIPITAQDAESHVDNFTALLMVNQANVPVLFNNGPIVTHPGGGANGFDLSALQNTISLPNIPIAMNTLGNLGPPPNRAADDFVICDAAGWNISTITVFAYQTGSPITSTITDATLRIWDGVPGAVGSNIVFGDTTTNVMASSCWTGVYRATLTDPLGSTRPVMAIVMNVNQTLLPGRYWIDYSASGSLASGPFTPPITRLGQPNTGNAMGSADGVAYAAIIDNGGSTATYRCGMPFLVRGTAASAFLLGDMDCSGTVDGRDISPFAGVLVGTNTDASDGFIADVNQDGLADLADIDAMTDLLLN